MDKFLTKPAQINNIYKLIKQILDRKNEN